MSEKNVRVAVPTEGTRRRAIRRRDVVVTLTIILIIVGIFFAFNRPGGGLGEGAFAELRH